MKAQCQIDSTYYLEHAMEEMNFSARAHDRILKVARTLADLSPRHPSERHSGGDPILLVGQETVFAAMKIIPAIFEDREIRRI